MPSKAVELTVEILIDTVSCPGVWLCADGDVSLSVFALGSSHHTARLPPLFPLLYKDTFFFRKRFKNVCSISNLNCVLKGETIYCELVQWKCSCEPCVLAQYLGSISDMLFPPNTCTSDGVDLLMRGTRDFPGILSPKIELSTKVRVDEVYDDSTEQSETRAMSPIGVTVNAESDVRRQRPVCHTRHYHRSRCSSNRQSPNRRGKAIQTVAQNEYALPRICINHNKHRTTVDSARPTSGYSDIHQRAALVLESYDPDRCRSGSRGRSRCRGKRGEGELSCNYQYPCVCEICREYHQLFHVK